MKNINDIEFNKNLEYTAIIANGTSKFTETPFNYLSSKKIIKCHFKNSNLKEHNLDNTIFEGCVFNNCYLSNIKTKQTAFKNCVFVNCTFTYSEFIDGTFVNSHYDNCDLSNTLFEESKFYFSSIQKSLVSKLSFRKCTIQSVVFQDDLSNEDFDLDGSNIFFNGTIGSKKNLANNPNSYWIKERKEIFNSAINYFKLIQDKYSLYKDISENEYGIARFINNKIEFVLSQDRHTETIDKTIRDLIKNNSYNYGQLMHNRKISAKENICPLKFLTQEMALTISIKNVVYLSDKYLSDILFGNFDNA